MPSFSSSKSASRTGVRLVWKRRASSAEFKSSPGCKRPSIMPRPTHSAIRPTSESPRESRASRRTRGSLAERSMTASWQGVKAAAAGTRSNLVTISSRVDRLGHASTWNGPGIVDGAAAPAPERDTRGCDSRNHVVVENRPVRDVAAANGLSESWLFEVLARYRGEGEAGFEPRSRRRKTVPHPRRYLQTGDAVHAMPKVASLWARADESQALVRDPYGNPPAGGAIRTRPPGFSSTPTEDRGDAAGHRVRGALSLRQSHSEGSARATPPER